MDRENRALELYKLIVNPDEELTDFSYVHEFGWVSDKEFFVWVSLVRFNDFVDEMTNIFGCDIFDNENFNANVQSDSVCIDLRYVLAGYVDIEEVFPKEKYFHLPTGDVEVCRIENYPKKEIKSILRKVEELKNDISCLKNQVDYQNGIICPECGSFNNRVFDSRENKMRYKIRRRKCLSCDNKWTTVEVATDIGFSARIKELEDMENESN